MNKKFLLISILIFSAAILFGLGFLNTADAQYGTYSCNYNSAQNNCYPDTNACTAGGSIPTPSACDAWDDKYCYSCCVSVSGSCVLLKDDGSRCTTDSECESGICGRSATGPENICISDNCVESPCPSGYSCDRVTSSYGVCRLPAGGEGDYCENNNECAGDLICSSTNSCIDPCFSDCIAGGGSALYCTNLCAGKSSEGGACSTSQDCADGLRCDDNACVIDGCTSVELGGVGKCSDGYYCDATTCVLYTGGEGDVCSNDDQCEGSLVCEGGTCTTDTSDSACNPACTGDSVCDVSTNSCVECLNSADCGGAGFACIDNSCVTTAEMCEDQKQSRGGLVPCGGPLYDIDTGEIIGQCPSCTLRDVFVLLHDLVEFVIWILAPILVTIMVVYGGVTILAGAGNPGQLGKGKNIITWALIGYIVILLAWIIVNTIFMFVGLAEWLGPGNWQWWNPTF